MQTFLLAARPDRVASAPMLAAVSATSATGVVSAALAAHAQVEAGQAAPPPNENVFNENLIASLPQTGLDALVASPRLGAIARHEPPSGQDGAFGQPLIDPLSLDKLVRPPSTEYPALVTSHAADRVQRDANFYVAANPAGKLVTQRQAGIYLESERWANTIATLTNQARSSGLAESEVQKLEAILRKSRNFDADAQLVRDLLALPINSARALRTFNDLDVYRRQHPDRITPDIVRALALGVGESRGVGWQAYEGVLGNASAINAAEALVRMPPVDYQAVRDVLDKAGTSFGTGHPTDAGGSAQMEKALILKAVAARAERLADTTAWNATQEASPACDEIVQFAQAIRGRNTDTLMQLTTAIDLTNNGKADALQQRWSMSCAQAMLQIARAEADPVYALWLHDDVLHSTSSKGAIAAEQKEQLEAAGGLAIERNIIVDVRGTSDDSVTQSLNRMLSPLTGRNYQQRQLENNALSRTQGIDYMEQLLKTGTDVPISVDWSKGGSHIMLVTDVIGTGADRRFLVTDPASGKTEWIKGDDIVNGNTDFFGARGTLDSYWW